jgi:L-threonylcarbamoyladenylate synthase
MVDNTPIKCKTHVIAADEEGMVQAVQALAAGKLVSFPTETVYGLGANALDPDACLNIFKTKGRPLTDPLIVHVHNIEAGLALVNHTSPIISTTFKQLGAKYWPGPLTLVTEANLDKIPMLITADTGFIGIRVPAHPIALQLLEKAGVPIAAPSANKFGHVSPTKAEHVYNDFCKDSEVVILDGGACSFGIESTVLKITESELIIIRKGGISL